MPDKPPSQFDNESDWMAYCVPFMMRPSGDNMPNKQAVAACLNMWRNRKDAGEVLAEKSAGMMPTADESRQEFIDRCTSESDMDEAACAAMWDRQSSHPKPKSAPETDRAWSVLTLKSIDSEQRTIEGMASTPEVDRIGDIVEPMGAKFTLPMPLLHHHKHDQPVGHVLVANATKNGIAIKARLAQVTEPGPLKDRIDTAWQEIKAGLVRGLSIGFRPSEFEPIADTGGLRFLKSEIYELSLVTIPANASASISVIKSVDDKRQAASGQAAQVVTTTRRPGASGKSVNLKLEERTMKTLSEQVAALEAKRAANEARMAEIMEKAVEEGRSTDESERDSFDELQREIETIDGDLKRFRALEKINLAKAQPVKAQTVEEGRAVRTNGGTIRVKGPDQPPGIRFARVVKVIGMARGNLGDAATIGQNLWPDDQPIVNILKAAVQAGTTTDATWAGPLVSSEGAVFADFLEYLRPMTVVGKFGTGNIPSLRRVPFRVPLSSQTSWASGYWVGESQAKPLTRLDFERTSLEPLKVANIAVVFEELLRYAALPAEALLRDELARPDVCRGAMSQ
jgi:HK97 family phage prohead protease